MKTERNILIAFLLNLAFSVFEFFGGIYTGSVAIISDSVHDMGDAISIGVSYFLERKSKKKADKNYTYGYMRYSIIGSLITTFILLIGSIFVIYNAICKIINPNEINYNGMILFAIIGVFVNFCAAMFTKDGDSLNQKAVNLHMLEDVLGWLIVLIGAIVIKFTNFVLIDPIMSIGVALFIFVNAFSNLKSAINIILEKVPENIDIDEIKEHILEIDGILDIHHVHIWSMDGINNYATLHIVTNKNHSEVKHMVREELEEHNIGHITMEIESEGEECHFKECKIKEHSGHSHGHHHHHHH